MAITVTRTAPPAGISGFTATADYGFEKCYNMESGSLVDRTTEFQNGATPVNSFAAQNDYIYLGVKAEMYSSSASVNDGRFISVYINLGTVASASIVPTFEYNTGNNTWATLAVTDGTNGFTQDGEISVTLASLPAHTTWVKGSQNGSGVEIGDSVDRCYIRIKRTAASLTTPPQIIEAGTGELSANTTYYYRANTLANAPIYSTASNNLMSAPSAEISATTTDYKRSIKLSWTGDSKFHMVWRTPISGNYISAVGQEFNYLSEINTYCQQVKGRYFTMRSNGATSDTSIMDTGLLLGFTRRGTSTTDVGCAYMTFMFYEYERGQISISGGTSGTPAKWLDVYNADVAGGWNSFLPLAPVDSYSFYHAWDCRDNLVIDGYITDNNFDIIFRGSLYTYAASTYMTFGTKVTYTDLLGATKNFYKNGGVMTFINCMTADYYCYFANTILYDCRIVQGVTTSSGRTYMHLPVFIGNNNQLYKSIINGGGSNALEDCKFSGTGLILEDVTLNGLRYGLTIDASSFATASLSGLTITGAVGITADAIPAGDVTFSGFTFKQMSSWLQACYLNSSNYTKVVNEYFLNPVMDVTTNGYFNKARVGINYTIYEQYTLDLKVKDISGTAISGATVKIYDGSGTEVYSKTTDVNGDITASALTYKKYTPGTADNPTYYNYYADVVTSYTYTMTISKDGYETYTADCTIASKTSLVIALKTAIPKFEDDNGNVFDRVDKTNSGTTSLRRKVVKV